MLARTVHYQGVPAALLLSLTSPIHADAVISTSSSAGWSSDPAENLVIAGRAGQEVLVKILPLPDGGFYVSWLDNTDGGYDVRLQRLDVGGRALWPENGILVASPGFSEAIDYGFDIDTDDNAVLSFLCCAQGSNIRVAAAKIDLTGNSLWGTPGIRVSPVNDNPRSTRLAGLPDGSVAVVWTTLSARGVVQKLDQDGAPIWGTSGVNVPGPAQGLRFNHDINAGLSGEAIVSWSNQVSAISRILHSQKMAAADGSALWASDGVRVSDLGNLPAGGFTPPLADGNGGVVFTYQDHNDGALDIRVQHIDRDGVRRFGNNGTVATTNTTRHHVSPAGAFDPASGNTFVTWVDEQTISMQVWHSLRVQRIDSDGERQWGDEGLELVPPAIATTGENTLSRPVVLTAPAGVIVAWSTGNTSVAANPIRAQYLDRDGQAIWPEPVPIKTSPTRTSRPTGATSTAGYAAFVWSDAPGNAPGFDVLGQNLQYSGLLGDIVFTDSFE